jgi:nucleoside-diphosphate-sugar epimerase
VNDKNTAITIIVGAGDVGGRVAQALNDKAHQVIAVSRSARDMANGIQSLAADVSNGAGLTKLPQRADALVFCVAPDERTPEAYRRLYVEGLQRVLQQTQFGRIVFVSSTAVYAQDGGEWVDEQSPALAETFNGKILREAETICHQHAAGTALRFTGIYGPGRNFMLRRALAGEAGRAHWTNRIHVEDVASAITHILSLASPKRIYCGNDDCPALESEVLAWLRSPEADISLLPPLQTTGRRVRNDLLRASGWQPNYPNYRAGYRQVFNVSGV